MPTNQGPEEQFVLQNVSEGESEHFLFKFMPWWGWWGCKPDLLQHRFQIHLWNKTQLKGKIPISFDVVSLYTNINNDEAIETAIQYTNKYHLYTYGLEARDLYELLHLLLDNNIFTYRNTTYRQNPWSGNGQSSEQNPCYFSNGPFRTNVHLPEPLPFTDHLRTLHRRHWNCCQQPKWSTTPTDIPQLQTPDYQVRTWTTQRRRLLTYPWRTNKARHWRQLTPQTIHEGLLRNNSRYTTDHTTQQLPRKT